MQEFLGSVRRSLVFNGEERKEGLGSGIAEKIGSCLRKSRVGLLSRSRLSPLLPPAATTAAAVEDDVTAPQIRWRKGELIGSGAYGRVYMGMNLDSGELLAVKQVSIAANGASKERAQTHIRDLEEEVKLLKNLSHSNIVRYLGTAREDETLNILLEFVPGGSISSLLGKFGSFPEAVIRMYTKQLLQGLEYLHCNGIIHRDIKGANILVDNKGCIKLADFGASKQVVELATLSGAKSMKGTPYWMAPEVILQTGHTFSADIWSVGCTVIEMATGKPPWSQQYQEVAALFYIGTTKSHPPIPDHLSAEAKDFLLKCLQKEPNLRAAASDLLQHPFVTGKLPDNRQVFRTSVGNQESSTSSFMAGGLHPINSPSPMTGTGDTFRFSRDIRKVDNVGCSTIYPERLSGIGEMWRTNNSDDMCQLDGFDEGASSGLISPMIDPFTKSYNPMSEPIDDWPCKFDGNPEKDFTETVNTSSRIETFQEGKNDFTFPCGPVSEEDDEVTESKIRAFLDEKALELKKLQSPLYEEFYNSLNTSPCRPAVSGATSEEDPASCSKLPPKGRPSPNRVASGASPKFADEANTSSPVSCSRRFSTNGAANNQILKEIPSPQLNEWTHQKPCSPSLSFSERQKKWKEELDEELEREREVKRLVGAGKTSSPNDRGLNRKRDRLRFISPGI
ncbi:mitogen-activated protein kinase kinase kinase NPK1-like [Aristolochia californica]|uniref:mitogen-activated protein kinase kinase kinase NPK1-like n=1 Tax=Aristolochia californica TaxID=171875 RepID=UPI0035E119E3